MDDRPPSILAVPCFRGSFGLRGMRLGACILAATVAAAWLFQAPGLAAKQKEPTTKTVSGKVLDKNDEGIGGAQVSLKDVQTGKSLAIYSAPDGQYRFADLNPHHDYEVQASSKGGVSDCRHISSVDTRMRLVINLTIPPAGP